MLAGGGSVAGGHTPAKPLWSIIPALFPADPPAAAV